jgi:hypothetical protein
LATSLSSSSMLPIILVIGAAAIAAIALFKGKL